MPWKSRAQQGYMHIHHPKIAREFDKATSKKQFKRLPKKVKRK